MPYPLSLVYSSIETIHEACPFAFERIILSLAFFSKALLLPAPSSFFPSVPTIIISSFYAAKANAFCIMLLSFFVVIPFPQYLFFSLQFNLHYLFNLLWI
jgi:hypothetical protein